LKRSQTLTDQITLSKSLGDLYDYHFRLSMLDLKNLQKKPRTEPILDCIKENKNKNDQSFREMLVGLLDSLDPD
jgi:hypothetical protein